jgi:hypothetical protein
MAELKTNESLLRALRRAASGSLTTEEVQRQRVSFIMGSLKDTSYMTRSRVKDILEKHDGRKAK